MKCVQKGYSNKHKHSLAIILLILAILCSGGNIIIPREPLLISIIILSLLATKGRIKKALIFPAGLVLVVMFFAVFHPSGLGMSFFIRLVNFISSLALLNFFLYHSTEYFIKNIYKILCVLPFQAILTFFLAKFLPFLFIEINVNGTTYETLGFIFNHHSMVENDSIFPRPDGFFYEPGVFQFYLNLCLYLALFIYRNYILAFFTVMAIFTLQSSTGVLILLVQIFTFFVINKNFAKYYKHWSVKLILGIIILLPVSYFVKSNFENKIIGENSGSFLARQYDLLSGINVVMNHPLLGIGFDYNNYKSLSGRMSFAGIGLDELPDNAFDNRETSSNGIIFMLYSIGIPMSLFFIFGMFKQTFFPQKLLFASILLMTLIGEMLIFTPFFLFFMFSAFTLVNSWNPFRKKFLPSL
jgi:hypothetical protein